MSTEHEPVRDLLDDLSETAGDDRVSVGDMVEALGNRGHGPFLTVPALVELSPIGAVPGVPTLLAAMIALFAGQVALGHDHVWLPGFLTRRTVSGERLEGAVSKLRPVARWMDRLFRRRLTRLAGPAATRAAAGGVLLLCLAVPPLEIFPFASSGPMSAIALIGLAMMVRDGLVMLIAFALAAGGTAVGVGLL